METRKSTTAGVMFWTPAPVRTSPTSSVTSENAWEDEDNEQTEKGDDFVRQMDENGIIGLAEALEDVGLGETDLDAGNTPAMCLRGLAPQEVDHSGPEELSHIPSEHLSYTDSPGEDDPLLSPLGDDAVEIRAGTEAEEVRQRIEEREEYLGLTEEEEDGEEDEYTSAELRATTDLAESCINTHLPASNHRCPVYQSTSSSTFPHLRHFTDEEMASFVGIEAETLPDMGFTESLPESHSSCMSLKSSPRCPPTCTNGEMQPAAIYPNPNPYSGVSKRHLKSDQAILSLCKTMQHSPEASCTRTVRTDPKSSPDRELRAPRIRTSAAELNEFRSLALSYRTPDFSKVEPRVHYPKDGYKPPKSKRSAKRESLSPEPPLVFKSPADIVKEVLLNTPDGSFAPPDFNRPQTSGPNSTVPQDFRSRQQATTLLEQLQEAYDRLLTKHAEAENTIDRLRLEAKDIPIELLQPRLRQAQPIKDRAVNLYSDPPKPGHFVHSGLSKEATKFMTLDYPQAQKADTNSASLHPNGHNPHQTGSAARPPSSAFVSSTRCPGAQAGQQLATTLYSQADKFLQQLQTFEDLLNNGKLKPAEQMKGLSQLVQGLDSLERGYLLARNEHKLLQQRGAEVSHFDPERELDGLIFQFGLRMDELKEQVEQMRHEQLICEAPPSPTLQPTTSSSSSVSTQSPPVPLLVDPGETPAVEVTSVSEENEKETEDEEMLNSVFLKPVNGKYRCVNKDFTTLSDHDQSFKDLPKLLDCGLREGTPLSTASRTDLQPGEKGHGHGSGSMEVQKSLLQRPAESEPRTSPPVHSNKRQTNKSNLPSHRASSQSTTLPVHPHRSNKTLVVRKSHSSSLSSLGEITASDRRSSKLQPVTRRVLSQDGIISPETDSGFVGSESSHLTPAAAPSPLHKRAPESGSAPQEVTSGKSQTGPVSAPSPGPSLLHRSMALELGRGSRQRIRCVESRHIFSCSPQRWVSQTNQTRPDSGSSEFGLESDCTYTVSEEGQSADPYTESTSSFCSSCPSSSPAAWRRHGDSLKTLSSTQVANRNDAIQTLQDEVTRLKDRLESCLKNKKPLSSVREAPSAEENYTHQTTSTPRIRSWERQHDGSGGGRKRRTSDDAEENTLRQTAGERSTPQRHQTSQTDILTRSTPRPQPHVSRSTQTSEAAAETRRSHTNTPSSRTQPRQDPVVSEAADEPDRSRSQAPLCPQCLLHHRGGSERPVGGNIEPLQTHSPSCLHHCPLCGCLEPHRHTKSNCRRDSKPAKSLDRAARSRYSAAPPVLLQCTPVCPPPLLLYSSPVMNSYPSPLYVPPADRTSPSSGVRGRMEVRGRTRRSLSVDEQGSMDSSLDRAIRAARHMKHTSRHMAHSLATGLHYQQLLSQSCTY